MPDNLGELKSVPLREVWEKEDQHFTPWLAENIGVLGDAIGMTLEVEAQEKMVGTFRADILCQDDDGEKVLVENQVEKSNHKHLGQIITYAAGLRAKTIVWIAREFADEHRAALDWLNANTGDDLRFFALEVQLWRIGDSQPAPKFNVVVRPNDWSKNVRASEGGGLSDVRSRYFRYWSAFLDSHGEQIPLGKGSVHTRSYHVFTIGRSGARITPCVKNEGKLLEVQFRMTRKNAGAFYQSLVADKSAIERELAGITLHWEPPTADKQRAYVSARKDADIADESDWQNQHKWFAETVLRFNSVLSKRILNLNLDDSDAEQ